MKKASKITERYVRHLEKENQELLLVYSIITHDLRSPFNVLINFSEMLFEDCDNLTIEEIKSLSNSISNVSKNTFNLLENLLIWSNLKRGKLRIDPILFALIPKINQNVTAFSELIKEKELKILIKIPLEFFVYVDENCFDSIFRNLFSNAIKFTPKKGEITISAKIEEKNIIKISFSDTGIGMSSKILKNLFNMNVQTNRKGTEGESSHGFGLMNCRDIIEKSGGNLFIESEEGKGSTFSFTLPIHE